MRYLCIHVDDNTNLCAALIASKRFFVFCRSALRRLCVLSASPSRKDGAASKKKPYGCLGLISCKVFCSHSLLWRNLGTLGAMLLLCAYA